MEKKYRFNNRKAIGILGGMGPVSSIYMQKVLIDFSVKYFGAKNNEDFPEITLNSIPVPDFITSSNNRSYALMMLKKRVKNFKTREYASLSLACNTAHILLKDLQNETDIPFISMIKEVVDVVFISGICCVGIIATPSTIKSKLYQDLFLEKSVNSITPTSSQLKAIERVVRNVIAGKHTKKDSYEIVKIALRMHEKGAKGIVLGCTELPLVFPEKFPLKVFNSVEILCMSLLRNYYSQRVLKKGGVI